MEKHRKVVVVGAGKVGSTFAYTLMSSGLAREIVLIDVNRELAQGEALDMNHGLFFAPPVEVRVGGWDDCEGAQAIVITAGSGQKPGQTRLDLVGANVRIAASVMDEITRRTRDSIIVMVTNPVDVLTYFALRHSGLEPGQVIGSGTVLDSARFRYLLSRHYNVDPRNVHAYIAGEHGDSEIALWSMVHIGGLRLESWAGDGGVQIEPPDRDRIEKEVRESAYHVIEYKGATNFAVSLALTRIVGAILRDENSILTLSTLVAGQWGIRDVCLSIPCVVNASGISYVPHAELDEREIAGLRRSAEILVKAIRQVV